ncbi:MAG: cellulose biosynthesis cyclic di-GMP-binding regulatory protein BcsB [Anaerolineae bacterium]|nr:cellulose biosynthesis cyclic di-GMP-binding regulatory protein BcsB [Anaerolineae bacterium]
MPSILLYRRILILLSLSFIAITSLFLMVQPARGQGDEDVYEVDLAMLGYGTEVLEFNGDRANYDFSLPGAWSPQTGTYLQLDLDYIVSGLTDTAPAALEIRLNGEILRTEDLLTSTIKTLNIEIPPELLRLAEDRHNNLEIILFSLVECQEGQEGISFTGKLSIYSSSKLHFVYRERPLFLDLSLYPKPFYYRSALEGAPVRLVLPDNPSGPELEGAAMIAAGLGALTRNEVPLQVSLGIATLPITTQQEHLLLIGTPERIPLSSQFNLPVPFRQRSLILGSQLPAALAPGQPFSYTLWVENTSTTTQSLTVEDRPSPLFYLEACPRCAEVSANLLRWEVENLSPGQTISATVQARLDEAMGGGQIVEHTATLLDARGEVINVDTLTSTLALETSTATVSSPTKGSYFFAEKGQGVPETDGLIQIFESPWNEQRGVLLVTGLNEAAVLLAAHALAAPSRLPGMQGQFAVVQATRPVTRDPALPEERDLTLSELGYDDLVLPGRLTSRNAAQLYFTLPFGVRVTNEAFLSLHLAHSVALNPISATLELSLNQVPFSSVELGPENTEDGVIKVPLPSQRLRAGRNNMEMRVTATDWPHCQDPNTLARYWATVYSDSFMHLPTDNQVKQATFDLSNYLRLLSINPDLKDVAVLLPPQVTAEEVQGMVQLLSLLGSQAQGNYFRPRVMPSNQAEPNLWPDHHLIVLGRPTRNPYLALINDRLPQPFIPHSDEIQQQVDNIVYRLPPGYDLGYIQLLPVPWNEARAVLVATGTTDTGFHWALNALSNRGLISQMKGNLALLVQEEDMRTTDTRQSENENGEEITSTLAAVLTPEAIITVTSTVTMATPVPDPATISPTRPASITSPVSSAAEAEVQAPVSRRPSWLIPLLSVSALLILIAGSIAIWQSRS